MVGGCRGGKINLNVQHSSICPCDQLWPSALAPVNNSLLRLFNMGGEGGVQEEVALGHSD